MWMLPQERNESLIRNTIEFMSEGCDPSRVLDDEDFVRYQGELVHPVHFLLGYLTKNSEQGSRDSTNAATNKTS
jgi:hypothetical protein